MFNLFGALPDILMGRNPKDALLGNALAVSAALAAPHLAPGLLGSSTAAEGGGLLAGSELNAAGYLAPEMGGTVAEQAAAPVVDMSTQAGAFDTANANSGGLLGRSMDTANKYAKPVKTVMDATQQAQGPQQPPIQPQPIQRTPMDMSAIFQNQGQQQQWEAQEQERRRQLMAQYASGIGRM